MPDEYIRRADALYAIQRQRGATRSPAQNRLLDLIGVDIVHAPAADVAEVVHGQWIGEGDGYSDGALVCDVWHCSERDYIIDDGTDDPARLPKYCAGCGAKMDEGTDGRTPV